MEHKKRCSHKLTGIFMSDGLRNCYKKPKYEIDGQLFCGIHAKKYLERQERNGKKIPEYMVVRL